MSVILLFNLTIILSEIFPAKKKKKRKYILFNYGNIAKHKFTSISLYFHYFFSYQRKLSNVSFYENLPMVTRNRLIHFRLRWISTAIEMSAFMGKVSISQRAKKKHNTDFLLYHCELLKI